MTSILHLGRSVRRQLLKLGSRSGNFATSLRFMMVARCGTGITRTQVAEELGCAISTVAGAVRRYLEGGADALFDRRRSNGRTKVNDLFREQVRVALYLTPQHCGWERPTWTRELLALEMVHRGFPQVAPCTMGRALVDIRARRGRPKPIVHCPWPRRKRQHVLAVLRRLAAGTTIDEPVYYADEVDIHLNPKIGVDWMNRGDQRHVLTPGNNQKHYLAGALHAQTRQIVWVDGDRKKSSLFCSLVDRLVEEHPEAKTIHIILDNFIIHSSKITQRHIERLGSKVQLHFLPPYCPDHNRIERFWQELHANVTRNHRCKTLQELLTRCFAFLDAHNRREHIKPSLRPAIPVAA